MWFGHVDGHVASRWKVLERRIGSLHSVFDSHQIVMQCWREGLRTDDKGNAYGAHHDCKLDRREAAPVVDRFAKSRNSPSAGRTRTGAQAATEPVHYVAQPALAKVGMVAPSVL